MAELVVCAEARQDSAYPAMNRHALRSLDNKAERLGVDHFALIDPSSAAWATTIDALKKLLALVE